MRTKKLNLSLAMLVLSDFQKGACHQSGPIGKSSAAHPTRHNQRQKQAGQGGAALSRKGCRPRTSKRGVKVLRRLLGSDSDRFGGGSTSPCR